MRDYNGMRGTVPTAYGPMDWRMARGIRQTVARVLVLMDLAATPERLKRVLGL